MKGEVEHIELAGRPRRRLPPPRAHGHAPLPHSCSTTSRPSWPTPPRRILTARACREGNNCGSPQSSVAAERAA
jgi:hypothetical protein